MGWSIFQYENNFISITREEANGIPFLKFRPNGYGGVLPTVIFYHGWHSSKEFIRFNAMTIAAYGYQIVVPDALHHGERDAIDHDNIENCDRYLWKIIIQSIKESKQFIDTIIREHDADAKRIGIMGSSMGAITAGGVMVENLNVKCLIGLNGTFAWQEAIKRNHMPPPSDEDNRIVKSYDPANNGDRIKEKAILILHGVQDTSVPIETQRLFYDKVSPLYTKNPSNLRLIEVANINHKITMGMIEDAVTWLKEHL
ncbi:prolyl oligopeptidase family serine peptidase [Clostridium tunisiense]|uniref:prolyl oligopeptidase family serine peptidase n=1 Tax=Clostridium tunisiense TaxID=219748 RepID=UPI0002ED46EB|nr:prolyl oligopeptidase family serine peptidase [Clostridium tunisiense]